jgi:hypothetical protein
LQENSRPISIFSKKLLRQRNPFESIQLDGCVLIQNEYEIHPIEGAQQSLAIHRADLQLSTTKCSIAHHEVTRLSETIFHNICIDGPDVSKASG